MIDGPTASVIVSSVLATGSAIIVAIIKFAPAREPSRGDADGTLETRVAVVETNFRNLTGTLLDLRNEIHELRRELKEHRGPR